MQPEVEIIGVHPICVTDHLLRRAVETQYYGDLSAEERQQVEYVVREELESIVLVELLIRRGNGEPNLAEFGQSEGHVISPNDQVAYDETFLTLDGELSCEPPAPGADVRFAFFLHFYDPSKPIITSYGPMPGQPLTPMPSRLQRLVEYQPYD